MNRRFYIMLASLIDLPVSLGARSAPPTEAPAGFDTPTLIQNPGSKSSSNGIAEPQGDTFVLDQQLYEPLHDVTSGFAPVYNGRAWAECHQNPGTAGRNQF